MIRRPAAVLALAVALALTGCATQTGAEEPVDPAASATPTPTPTPELLVVADGDQPPLLFGGDCTQALDPAAIDAANGVQGATVPASDPPAGGTLANAGGISCPWTAGGVTGVINILPKQGLDGAELTADEHDWRFVECEWGCEWLWESDDLWISGYSNDLPQAGREEADRRAGVIGADIPSRLDSADVAWERAKDEWWPAMTCPELAAVVGAKLDADVSAEPAYSPDPPLGAYALADVASNKTWCTLTTAGTEFAVLGLEAGTAWGSPSNEQLTPVEVTTPGVTASSMPLVFPTAGTTYELTDGVNVARLDALESSPWSSDELLTALAELVASDFS
jgi:hypothetical protein